jgi:hypothetical protein
MATITSTPHLAPVQTLNNLFVTQSQGSVIPTIPSSMIPVIPSFAYSGLTTPYQGILPAASYANPVFPTPYMSMVSPEVWGAGEQGWIANPAQLAYMNRLEELRTRLAFTESSTITMVSANQGTIPVAPAVVAKNTTTTNGGERDDKLSKPYRPKAFIVKSKFTS